MFYYVVLGYTLVGSVLSHAFSNALLDFTEEMNKRQTLKCNSHCQYGFVPDVEGELTCVCYDPCSTIMCLQETVCVASMPRHCKWEPCVPETRCKEERPQVQIFRKDHYFHTWKDFPINFPSDEPDQLWVSHADICSQALPVSAVACKHKRTRWYYNSMTGKCEKFIGCITNGNNFGRKIYCKERCSLKYTKKTERKSVESAAERQDVCNEKLNTNLAASCSQPTKRWHFNPVSGKCERIVACETPGNNFSKKIVCKSRCLKRSNQFLRFDVKDSRLSKHSPS